MANAFSKPSAFPFQWATSFWKPRTSWANLKQLRTKNNVKKWSANHQKVHTVVTFSKKFVVSDALITLHNLAPPCAGEFGLLLVAWWFRVLIVQWYCHWYYTCLNSKQYQFEFTFPRVEIRSLCDNMLSLSLVKFSFSFRSHHFISPSEVLSLFSPSLTSFTSKRH